MYIIRCTTSKREKLRGCLLRLRMSAVALVMLVAAVAKAQVPFLRNYMSSEYGAHNRNSDVVATDDGMVFVANFEGLLYYDKAEWHIIHTPSITRITALCRDTKGTVWAGGYNYLGFLKPSDKGQLLLHEACQPGLVQGEVVAVWPQGQGVAFRLSDGKAFVLADNALRPLRQDQLPPLADGSDGVVQRQDLGGGLTALATTDRGIVVTDQQGHELCSVSEQNGLCSDNVNKIAYDGRGLLWGATDKGLFAMAVPSAYMRYAASEGLHGEVLSFGQIGQSVYAGTIDGLYRQDGQRFVAVGGITHACWQIAPSGDALLAATSDGVYRVLAGGQVQQLSNGNTLSLLPQLEGLYTGELDGVYLTAPGSQRSKVSDVEKVVKLFRGNDGTLWMQSIYGQVWRRGMADAQFALVAVDADKSTPATLVRTSAEVMAIGANATQPFAYPQFSFTDQQGCTWLTNSEGRRLYLLDERSATITKEQLQPLADYVVEALHHDNDRLWIGGDFGAVVLNTAANDPAMAVKPRLVIRSVVLGADSVLWGGVGEVPVDLPRLGYHDNHLRFTFALDHAPLVGKTLYRYRLSRNRVEGGTWSAWTQSTEGVFAGLPSGSYVFEVQALTATGVTIDTLPLSFIVSNPFYLRWYMVLLYLVLFILLILAAVRWRLRRLSQEKIRLESIVQERTAEVVRQKDEIEEKSNSLEQALHELGEAQHELIRQEKMATVGKLTQGLIDRILNPLNYINNFAKLSEGLVKDLEANIDDDKDAMNADNYEDTIDVLGMLRGNLQKVSEHGQNTTRTLKAMEEMLKDRSGGIVDMDLAALLRQDYEMLQQYFAKDIVDHHIATRLECPYERLPIKGNADQLSKTVMSLLGNAVYAVVRRAQREQYQPEVALAVQSAADSVTITVSDNGMGIEPAIIDKVFDPFFTTKTTGEAAGVGLYLSREIAQNHGGDIRVESQKNAFTRFIITLPNKQQ